MIRPLRPQSLALATLALVTLCACDPEPLEPSPDCPEGYSEDGEGNCLQQAAEATELQLYEGDLEVESTEELEAFCSEFNAVSGNVELVTSSAIGHLDGLDCLLAVGGHLHIDELSALEAVDLPALVQVGGDLYIQGNNSLSSIQLPSLERVGGAVAIQYNFELQDLEAPALWEIGGLLHVFKTGLPRLHLPALEFVGSPEWQDWVPGEPITYNDDLLYIRVNTELQEIDLPQLQWIAGVLKISSNDVMTSVSMPSLRQLGGGLYVSFSESCREVSLPLEEVRGFLYLQHTWQTSFSLPELTSVWGDFSVDHNHLLELVEMPQLGYVGGMFSVTDNPQLPGSLVDGLIDTIGEENINGPIHTAGNGPGR